MKYLKKALISSVLMCALLLSLVQTCMAAGISVSAGQSTVSVGKTVSFTITVPSGTEAWTYSVAYSDNLSLESGDLSPMGFEGESRSNQLVFRANSTGTATVRITAGSYCIGGVDYDASGSASVTVIAANKTDSGEPKPSKPGVSRSSNNALSSLTVSAGELTPAFDPAVTDYTLSLPLESDKLTVTATPSDSKATVQGDGEIALQGGANTLSVVVTAENGDKKTYTIVAKVAQAPTLFLRYNDQQLGAVKDLDDVTPPAGFAAAEPIEFDGDSLPIWVNAVGDQILVYMVNEETAVTGFYLFSQSTGVILSPYIPLSGGELPYIYTGIPADLPAMAGLTPAAVEAFGATLDGWAYDDPAMKEFYVLYLMNADGIYGCYTYDSAKETLQRFSGAVYAGSSDVLRVPMLYVYIAGGVAALLLILVIVLACVSGSRGKKLREFVGDNPSQADEPTQPEDAPLEAPESESVPEETPEEQPEQDAEPVAPAEEEPAPESESVPEEEPAELPTEEAEQSAEEAADDPAEEAPEQEETPAQPSLEDTLRNLPLTDLLNDIHDL